MIMEAEKSGQGANRGNEGSERHVKWDEEKLK